MTFTPLSHHLGLKVLRGLLLCASRGESGEGVGRIKVGITQLVSTQDGANNSSFSIVVTVLSRTFLVKHLGEFPNFLINRAYSLIDLYMNSVGEDAVRVQTMRFKKG